MLLNNDGSDPTWNTQYGSIKQLQKDKNQINITLHYIICFLRYARLLYPSQEHTLASDPGENSRAYACMQELAAFGSTNSVLWLPRKAYLYLSLADIDYTPASQQQTNILYPHTHHQNQLPTSHICYFQEFTRLKLHLNMNDQDIDQMMYTSAIVPN